MSTTSGSWPITKYTIRHTSWPYKPSDFTRQDPSPDASFYSAPRFVTHIDDAAIATLREYYDKVLPSEGRILDFCSSWVSHYPKRIEDAAAGGTLQVVGMGMNKAELDANKVLNAGRLLIDLNSDPNVAGAIGSDKLDSSTNVVSTDYLTKPLEVLRSVREVTKPGGTIHLTISNRCFPTKAISRWLHCSEDERLQMIGDYLHFAGWKNIEIVELSNGKVAPNEERGQPPGNLQSLMSWMGVGSRDPLWVVRARN